MGNSSNYEDDEKPEVYERFLKNLSNWIETKGLIETNITKEQVEEVEEILKLDPNKVTNKFALECSLKLHYYVEYLYSTHNKEKAILDWCEESIWYIIGDKMKNYGDGWVKWQEKYNSAIKENPLAIQINKLKNNVKARVTILTGRIENLKRIGEIFHDIGKRY